MQILRDCRIKQGAKCHKIASRPDDSVLVDGSTSAIQTARVKRFDSGGSSD